MGKAPAGQGGLDLVGLAGGQAGAIGAFQQAEDRSRELKRSAHEYCEDALRRTEEAVSEAYTEIKQSRANFRAASNTMSGAGSANPRPVYDAEADNEKA